MTWGILWRSTNKLDGKTRRLMWKDGVPLLFSRKHEATRYIRERYGYIATRKDLRKEPHGWRVPIPAKVSVIIEELG